METCRMNKKEEFCTFEGAWAEDQKKRLEELAREVERSLDDGEPNNFSTTWLFLCDNPARSTQLYLASRKAETPVGARTLDELIGMIMVRYELGAG